jgi:F-type H+-transporting ATPase subunit gamma
MTRRHNLERHRHSLAEIREIMNSMKTLAYLETRKLAHFLDAQHAVVQSIEVAASDMFSFYPEILARPATTAPVFILIGTERGFCGDFNHALIRYLETTPQEQPRGHTFLVPVGHKLITLLEGDVRVESSIDGASIVEEVPALLDQLVKQLTKLQDQHGALSVFCLYHSNEDEIALQQLLPSFQHLLHKSPRFSQPPMLNQPPMDFMVDFTEQYLFAVLHEMLYTSLMIENQYRIEHLEGAVRHLDDESALLTRKCNALRQEEIIEEIEVILLSATHLKAPGIQE